MKIIHKLSMMLNEGKRRILRKQNLILMGIIALGFVLRLYFATTYVIHGDENGYIYDGHLINKGEIPFKDYHTRSPVFIFMIAIFLKVFGQDYFSARLLSVVASTISIYLIHRIGRELFEERIGLIAAFLFSFSPYTMKWGVTIHTEVVQIAIILFAQLFFITAIKTEGRKYFFMNGILLGFAILVRRSTLVWVLGEGLCLLIIFSMRTERKRLNKLIRPMINYLIIVSGVMIVVISILAIFSMLTNFSYISNSFIKSAGIVSPIEGSHHLTMIRLLNYQLFYLFLLPLLYLFLFIPEGFTKNTLDRDYKMAISASVFIFYIGISINFHSPLLPALLLLCMIVTLIPFQILNQNSKERTLIHSIPFVCLIVLSLAFYNDIELPIILVTISAIVMISLLKLLLNVNPVNDFRSAEKLPKFMDTVVAGLVIISLLVVFRNESNNNLIEENVITLLILLCTLLTLWLLKYGSEIDRKYVNSHVIIVVWFFSVFGFYLFYGMWKHVIVPERYWIELTPIFCLMGGIAVHELLNKRMKDVSNMTYLLAIFLILAAGVSQSMIFTTEKNTQIPTPGTVIEIADYIKERTSEDDEIFTGCLAIAVQANRRVVFDISHPYYYKQPEQYVSEKNIRYPTLTKLGDYLVENNIQYAIIDVLTSHYYFSLNPGFKDFFYTHYELEREIDNISIMALKSK